MKKSLLLGASALAAVALAAPQAADAGEMKVGGYYQFRMLSTDNTPGDIAGEENAEFWSQRVLLNFDFIASEKSHAHMLVRALDSKVVQGADAFIGAPDWQIRQAWLETEAWGVGMKVGNMPISMNDRILIDTVHDNTSVGAALLSKNFGGTTVVGGLVKVSEFAGTAATYSAQALADSRDVDLWVLSALGKVNNIDYQATAAFLNQQDNFVTALGASNTAFGAANGTGTVVTLNDNVTDGWLALTLGTTIEGIDLTGTAIYETGMDNTTAGSQLEDDGFIVAGRVKGKAGFGTWQGYGFYSGEDYTAPYPGGDQPKWSDTWDSGGTGAYDLMQAALSSTGGAAAVGAVPAANNSIANDTSNMWGIGAGLAIKAGAWTIKPQLDYAQIVEEKVVNSAGVATNANYDKAFGGTLGFSTKIQEATTLDISGTWVDPTIATNAAAGTTDDVMHYVQASVKMSF